jgi:hypothetical protein
LARPKAGLQDLVLVLDLIALVSVDALLTKIGGSRTSRTAREEIATTSLSERVGLTIAQV